jgi:hypothetical protein
MLMMAVAADAAVVAVVRQPGVGVAELQEAGGGG